jgi:hypothetical protein
MAVTLAEMANDHERAFFNDMPGLRQHLRPGIDEVTVRMTRSGRAYECATSQHRYHRDVEAARWCAWRAMPMKKIDWVPAQERESRPSSPVIESPIAGSGLRERESRPSGAILGRINAAIYRMEERGLQPTHIELDAEDYAALRAYMLDYMQGQGHPLFDIAGLKISGLPVERGAVSRVLLRMEEAI